MIAKRFMKNMCIEVWMLCSIGVVRYIGGENETDLEKNIKGCKIFSKNNNRKI